MPETVGIKVGDAVTRMLAGVVEMDLVVTEVTETTIVCGDWTFDRETLVEIDDECGWGPKYGVSGSFIKRKE